MTTTPHATDEDAVRKALARIARYPWDDPASNDAVIIKELAETALRAPPLSLPHSGEPVALEDGGPTYEEWKTRALNSRVALRRLHLAVRALGKIGSNNVTLFEDSPLKSQEAYEAWTELNAAQGDAARALGFKLLFDGEWLRAKIAADPDTECEVRPTSPPATQIGDK